MRYMKWRAESSTSNQKLSFFVNSLIRKFKSLSGTRGEISSIRLFLCRKITTYSDLTFFVNRNAVQKTAPEPLTPILISNYKLLKVKFSYVVFPIYGFFFNFHSELKRAHSSREGVI